MQCILLSCPSLSTLPSPPSTAPAPRARSWPAALLDPQSAALAFALIKTGGAVGGFAGPLAVGALSDSLGGFGGALLLLAGVALGCAALVAGECVSREWQGMKAAAACCA